MRVSSEKEKKKKRRKYNLSKSMREVENKARTHTKKKEFWKSRAADKKPKEERRERKRNAESEQIVTGGIADRKQDDKHQLLS